MIRAAGIALGLVIAGWNAQAAEMRWSTEPYSHYSDQEPLRDVLKNLLATQGIPLVVSAKVQDVVSARFEQTPPEQVFNRLASAYNLTWYFDGQMLYVYPMDDLHTATIKLTHITPKAFSESLDRLGILDRRFQWNASEADRLVYFAGPQRFVNLVMEMAKVLDIGQSPPTNVVYKWKDARGITNYSTAPPTGATKSPVNQIAVDNEPIRTAPVIGNTAPPPNTPPSAPATASSTHPAPATPNVTAAPQLPPASSAPPANPAPASTNPTAAPPPPLIAPNNSPPPPTAPKTQPALINLTNPLASHTQ